MFINNLISNKSALVLLVLTLLNNLAKNDDFPKILSHLPIEFGIRPILSLYITDGEGVNYLITNLCNDNDFKTKISSFVPLNFAILEDDAKK